MRLAATIFSKFTAPARVCGYRHRDCGYGCLYFLARIQSVYIPNESDRKPRGRGKVFTYRANRRFITDKPVIIREFRVNSVSNSFLTVVQIRITYSNRTEFSVYSHAVDNSWNNKSFCKKKGFLKSGFLLCGTVLYFITNSTPSWYYIDN